MVNSTTTTCGYTLSSYDPVRVSVPPASVTEAMVDAQLEREVARLATYTDDPGPAAEGDYLRMELRVTVDGQPAPELSGDDVTIFLARGMMPDGFVDGVLGMAKGERHVFDFAAANNRDASAVPDEFHVEATLLTSRRRTVPELTDALVRTRLSATDKTVVEFRERVRRYLQEQLTSQEGERREQAADAALAERLVGVVPDDEIERRRDEIADALQASLAARGMSVAQYAASQGLDERKFQMSLLMQARDSLRQGYALDALAEHLCLDADDAAVEAALAEVAAGHVDEARAAMGADEGARAYVEQTARRLKAHAWLMSTAVFE